MIRRLEANPWLDGETKVSILVAPLVLSAYDDGRWQVIYRVVDERFIEVYGVARASRAQR